MRKYTFLIFLLTLTCGFVSAQLVNQGGTITIQAGATLIVETDITNTSGTINNNGDIQVAGDFVNDGTFTSGANSKLIFTGATASILDANGATAAILENAKTAGDVTLASAISVDEQVDFSGTSDIILNDFGLTLSETATTNGSATGHFVTDGVGTLNKEVSAAGTFTADLGDGTNYSPLEAVHSGTYAASTISTKVTNVKHPDIAGLVAGADDYINRYWEVDNTITTPNIALTGTYVAGDVSGTEGDMVGARFENVEWEFGTGAQAGSTVSATSTTSATELTGMNFFGKASVKVFLEGAYNVANDDMDAKLRDYNGGGVNLIASTSPYADALVYDTPLPADIVDWIEIETVGEAGAANVRRSALLKTDGTIVDVDGVSPVFVKDANTDNFVNVYHRNHMPISTAAQVDLVDSATPYNATLSANIYNDSGIVTENAKELEAGVYGLFRGNGNSDTSLSFIDYVIVRANTTSSQAQLYSVYDVNMDGNLSFIDYVMSRLNSTTSKPAHLQ